MPLPRGWLVPQSGYYTSALHGQSGRRCKSAGAHIVHPLSLLVNRRNQPSGERRPNKLLGQVRACPELTQGMASASNTIPIAPSRPTSAGSNATSTSTAGGTQCLQKTAGIIVNSSRPCCRERPQLSQRPHSHLTISSAHILAAKTVPTSIAARLPRLVAYQTRLYTESIQTATTTPMNTILGQGVVAEATARKDEETMWSRIGIRRIHGDCAKTINERGALPDYRGPPANG